MAISPNVTLKNQERREITHISSLVSLPPPDCHLVFSCCSSISFVWQTPTSVFRKLPLGFHPRLGLLCSTGFQCFLLFHCSEQGTVCSTLSTCVLLVLFFTCCLSKLTTACSSFSYGSFLFSFFPIIYATLLPRSPAPPLTRPTPAPRPTSPHALHRSKPNNV